MRDKPVERPYASSPEADALEQAWWDRNASLIARVWEMPDEVSRVVRRSYLARARAFFRRGRQGPVTVAELGCGSGWVGQALASPSLRIFGTDFSQSQIALARSNAERRGVATFTHYQVATSDQWPAEAQAADGVLIHAFLHHLSGAELDGFMAMLRANTRPGTRIFVYEPAFHVARAPAEAGAVPTPPPRLLKLGNAIVSRLSRYYGERNLLDQETRAAFVELLNRADREGWHLSPKEVPFDVEAFSAKLGAVAQIERSYWATILAIGWVFETNLVSDERVRRRVCRFVLPLLAAIDRSLARNEDFLASLLVPPMHAFRVWECIAR